MPYGAAALTALGAAAPTPTVPSSASDEFGVINFGTGTGPTAGAILRLDLAVGRTGAGVVPGSGLVPILQPLNAATAALGPFWPTLDVNDGRRLTITCTVAPAASQAVTTYSIGYYIPA